jgi:hypothetical protein
VTAVEIKDIDLPQEMRRAIAKQAEAERERRAKVINAEGELQASTKLSQAARVLQQEPAAIQLRYLQTVAEIATENNSTTLFPIPIDLFRPFIERFAGGREGVPDHITEAAAQPTLPPAPIGGTKFDRPEKVLAERNPPNELACARRDLRRGLPDRGGLRAGCAVRSPASDGSGYLCRRDRRQPCAPWPGDRAPRTGSGDPAGGRAQPVRG